MNDEPKLPTTAPATSLGEYLIRALADPNITADKMQIMLQMQRELVAEQRREAFQSAFEIMAYQLPQVSKQGTVELVKADGRKVGSYKYAKWEDMDTVLRPILHEHGFALSFYSRESTDRRVIVGGRLMHRDGHFETAEISLPPDTGPGRNELQASGSAISYAKRYLAELLLNVVRRGDDDDGVSAGLKRVDAQQCGVLRQLLGETKTKEETFLRMFVTGATTIEEIPVRDYARLINALEEKKASLARSNKK
jgi:hypothetical protein